MCRDLGVCRDLTLTLVDDLHKAIHLASPPPARALWPVKWLFFYKFHCTLARNAVNSAPLPFPRNFWGLELSGRFAALRCHPRRDQGGKGRAVSLGDETALPSLQFSFLRPFWSQRSTFKLSFDVKHGARQTRYSSQRDHQAATAVLARFRAVSSAIDRPLIGPLA